MHEMFAQMMDFFKSMGIWGLALNSFVESFFLVPPPDILLIFMDLANPAKALFYALVCTIASAFGGAVGYGIGYWGGRPAFNWLFRKGGMEKFEAVEKLYNKYGTLAVFFSAFTPIPYKVFTIASGILSMNFWKFMIASFFGRGLRFFIVSIVLMLFGEAIKQYIELVIIAVTVVIILFFIILYKKRKSFV
ncbi:MAG: DedA family protein [Candidatus Gastranaerophilales bacterium]|nr:DedA family protein [Candidatus Gastranaerophilales bacterium]